MSYIIKNTSALVNTRLTDTGRQKLSQGNFNISYFQVGDSEVTYNTLPLSYNQYNTMILEPNFNSQNSSGVPQSNKQYVKYPYYVDGVTGNTYGIPFMDSVVSPVYNRAAIRGFFSGITIDNTTSWSALTNSLYVINSNYVVNMSLLNGSSVINLIYSGCNSNIVRMPAKGDIITIYYDGMGKYDCSCETTPSITPTPTPTPTPSKSYDPCSLPEPTPTPSSTCCPSPTPDCSISSTPASCVMSMSSCYAVLTYKIVDICGSQITLDRPTPDFSLFSNSCYARVLVYPPNMTSLYDSVTPAPHWNTDVLNFESVCDTDEYDVKVWNMNIPWSENPAGLIDTISKDYTNFGSINYLGTKEYLGYMSDSGQTDTDSVYFYNSFDEKIIVTPKEQKAIAIIHYTNNSIDYFYGEKFALQPYDPSNPEDTTGQARNFKLHIPWLMWHKSSECCNGQTFWVDPPGFEEFDLFQVEYLLSTKNTDMNTPGIRYYHLWDTNPNSNGLPNRVGKVFPDQKIVIIDDEEIIAAMSYKSNRNWTLPAPNLSLVTPNTCGVIDNSTNGVLTGNTEYMYVTYRLSNSSSFTNSLHCNYYMKIQGPSLGCNATSSQNVGIRFGNEFNCLNYTPYVPVTTTTTTQLYTTTTTTICPTTCDVNDGFVADRFEIICQKVSGNDRPNSSEWRIIDMTSQLSGSTFNGNITQEGLTGNTFVITDTDYENAPIYDLSDYVNLTPVGYSGVSLNFGDEYYFYGSLETDIQATIYEMRYKINLSQTEFQTSSNPTWTKGNSSYITEIGLYDSDKNLMVVSKLQSPVLRQGIQQMLVKFDF